MANYGNLSEIDRLSVGQPIKISSVIGTRQAYGSTCAFDRILK